MDEWMDEMCCPKVRKLCSLGGTVPQVCWADALAGPPPTVLYRCDYDRQVSCQQECLMTASGSTTTLLSNVKSHKIA